MARLNAQQAATFPSGNGMSFLQLQNDGDSAVVRFAYDSLEELMSCDSIHSVQDQTGKYRQVDCLRIDNSQPLNLCPLCEAGFPVRKVVYLNVRNEQTGEMQVWQRTESYVLNTLAPTLKEYLSDGVTKIKDIPFKITRHGAKGDPKTNYLLITMPIKPIPDNQFGEPNDPREKQLIRILSASDMQDYLNTGILPSNDNSNVTPRETNNVAMGRPVNVQDYMQQNNVSQPNIINNRRTMMNNNQGGY